MSIARQIMAEPGRFSQEQLQQAMDQGLVDAYIAIPLIRQKAMEAARYQMAALAEDAPEDDSPTVAEEILQQAGGLPMLSSNLAPGYAPGGIVAFGDGGNVQHYRNGLRIEDPERYIPTNPDLAATSRGIDELASYADEEEEKPAASQDRLAEAYKRVQAMMGGLPDASKSRESVRAELQRQAADADRAAREQIGYRLLEGAGMTLSDEDAYMPAKALGRTLRTMAPRYAEDVAARRKAGIENLLAQANLDKEARQEGLAALTGGMDIYKAELEDLARTRANQAKVQAAQIAARAARQGELGQYVDNYVAAELEKIRLGKRPPASIELLKQEGQDALMSARAQPSIYGTNVRAGLTLSGQDIEKLGLEQKAWNEAVRTAQGKAVFGDPFSMYSRTRNRLMAEDPTGQRAAKYEFDVTMQYYKKPGEPVAKPDSGATKQPSAASAPSTAPATKPPTDAVTFLKSNNTQAMRDAFDAKYGKGAAARALGG